jgi:hypothetical protein
VSALLFALAVGMQTPAPAAGADKEGRVPVEVRAKPGDGVSFRASDKSFGLDMKARLQTQLTF